MIDYNEWAVLACTVGLMAQVVGFLLQPLEFSDSNRRWTIAAVGCSVFFAGNLLLSAKRAEQEALQRCELAEAVSVERPIRLVYVKPTPENGADIYEAIIHRRIKGKANGLRNGTGGTRLSANGIRPSLRSGGGSATSDVGQRNRLD